MPSRKLLRSVMIAASFLYLGFHVLHGEQGVYALMIETEKRRQMKAQLAEVEAKRAWYEAHVAHMRSESLDPDLLDEQSRRYLGLAGPDEMIVLTDE